MGGNRKQNRQFHESHNLPMIQQSPTLNAFWSTLLIEELVRSGIDQFCISPGSRSTPLTLAAAENHWAKTQIFYDERAAGYFAVGYARATGQPAVLICTSGTAAANYLPAIVEASVENLPLIILTSDRPPELRDSGANQTIYQPHIYGTYTRWQCDLPCPTTEIAPEFVLTTIDQAIFQAQRSPAGPVHINCMFREPLAPSANEPGHGASLSGLAHWLKNSSPFTQYTAAQKSMGEDAAKSAATAINSSISGLVILGQIRKEPDRQAALEFCRELNWPVALDIQSSVRVGELSEPFLPYFDQLLLSQKCRKTFQPDTIIQLGDRIVSKRVQQFISQSELENYIVVVDHPFRRDESHKVTHRFDMPITAFCQALAGHLIFSQPQAELNQAHALLKNHIADVFKKNEELTEPFIAHKLSQIAAQESGIFLGNSMPIRDVDMFAGLTKNKLQITANRGASGIDGNLATAAGFAAGLQKPVTVLLGDLTILHDLNSLHLVSHSEYPMIVILLNNHGGGIFHFLPVALQTSHFETYFGTPHELNFQQAAAMFSLQYFAPTSANEFLTIFQHAVESGRSTLIEIFTDRKENWNIHQQIQKEIIALLDG
ncbi:MAG: 2-succinyl-5-enolpyruvyl-6-hydroxy-3-cyclohexene-1-carboxylic-acid synthase [Deferribacteres bacterium]|nr:2-succinyl-5-enolpyruvyl-6-hydroxy-3-cyclohexene-1-carboxylic-acid synthase [candidate division KSB1 bacterium]MCB9500829.1 2-succinyl-5-enolpyruvyl-6-hydroxy-3-cyclohexene-1-carboxylic-acid synthase [Deferribacteres bacterium]